MDAYALRKRVHRRLWIYATGIVAGGGLLLAARFLPVQNRLAAAVNGIQQGFAALPPWALWVLLVILTLTSGMWSGANLGFFTHSRLFLDLRAKEGDKRAAAIAALREDSNFLLSTILWSNVMTNVLLTLVSDVVMPGLRGFIFSVFVITIPGEILPQSVFSRYPLQIGSLIAPIVRIAQLAVWPLAAGTGLVLDALVGPDAIIYTSEEQFQSELRAHAKTLDTEVATIEADMAIRSLQMDDISCEHEGSPIDPRSVLAFEFDQCGKPLFPLPSSDAGVEFRKKAMEPGQSWAFVVDASGKPRLAVDLTELAFHVTCPPPSGVMPFDAYCHEVLILGAGDRLDKAIIGWARRRRLEVKNHHDPHRHDVALYAPSSDPKTWRVITGADLFAFLTQDAHADGHHPSL